MYTKAALTFKRVVKKQVEADQRKQKVQLCCYRTVMCEPTSSYGTLIWEGLIFPSGLKYEHNKWLNVG